MNFRLSDRTLRSRFRILEISQELVKICAAPWNCDFRVNFDMSGQYKQPDSTGESLPIKAGQPEPSPRLWSAWERGNTSTRIWTRALQPDQEEVSSWRFRRVWSVSGPPTFSCPAGFSPGTGILTPTKILSSACFFCKAPIFCKICLIF